MAFYLIPEVIKKIMRRKWKKAKPKVSTVAYRSNEKITAPMVFLIDENKEQVGPTPTSDALARARELELDLVEVAPKANPPVAKIVDFGQLKYEQDKKAHKQRVQQKKVDTKEIRLSVRISGHDFDFRLNQANKFLEKGNKLKIDLILKGRERQHPDKARETIKSFVDKLKENETFDLQEEQPLTKQGGRFNIILVNKNS